MLIVSFFEYDGKCSDTTKFFEGNHLSVEKKNVILNEMG